MNKTKLGAIAAMIGMSALASSAQADNLPITSSFAPGSMPNSQTANTTPKGTCTAGSGGIGLGGSMSSIRENVQRKQDGATLNLQISFENVFYDTMSNINASGVNIAVSGIAVLTFTYPSNPAIGGSLLFDLPFTVKNLGRLSGT
jgi:hypothetical protein